MNEDGRRGVEERSSLAYAATSVEQCVALIADADVKTEVVVGLEIVDYLLRKMVYIHHNALKSRRLEIHNNPMEKRFSPYSHQCLWHRVGQWTQAGAKSRRKYHCLFHSSLFNLQFSIFNLQPSFFASSSKWIFCSRWIILTSTPNFSWICSARCCAE